MEINSVQYCFYTGSMGLKCSIPHWGIAIREHDNWFKSIFIEFL